MNKTLSKLAGLVGLLLVCGSVAASAVRVDVDTSSLGVSEGYLELQLSATTDADLVTALVTELAGADAISLVVGDSWGYETSSGGYVLYNSTSNDLLFSVEFGSLLSFYLDVEGAVDADYVTHFTVSLWDAAFDALGDASAVNAAVLDLAWVAASDGSGTGQLATTYASEVVSVNQPAVLSSVPEPTAAGLLMAGLAVMGLTRRRRVWAQVAKLRSPGCRRTSGWFPRRASTT